MNPLDGYDETAPCGCGNRDAHGSDTTNVLEMAVESGLWTLTSLVKEDSNA